MMNPRDRFIGALTGTKIDKVPLVLPEYEFIHSQEQLRGLADPGKRDIGDRVLDDCASFVFFDSHINRTFVTPPQFVKEVNREESNSTIVVTNEIDTPKGKLTHVVEYNSQTNTEWVRKYPVESPEDIEKIRSVPWELPEKLSTPDLSELPPQFYKKSLTRAEVSSPFVCVAGMMKYEYFLFLAATEPHLVNALTTQCHERILSVLDVLLSAKNIDYVWMGGCEWLTPPMAPPKMYEDLVQPFEREIIERVHEAGALVHVHCHGNIRSTLEMVIDRGGDFVEPVEPPPDGDITMSEAKALAKGKITLGGNIEARILEYGDPDEVEKAARDAFEGGKHRVILTTTSAPLGQMTPRSIANYHRLIDVWEELSPIREDGANVY